MPQILRTIYSVICIGLMMTVTSCRTPAEEAKMDAENKEKAIKIAEEYFDEGFEYDFFFYNGGGGDAAIDVYVFKKGDTINCVSVPVEENAPAPRVYYDCTLHLYGDRYWSLEKYEDSEKVDSKYY